MSIPNLITIGRLLLVPLIVWLTLTEQHGLAFIAFLAAGISDGVDGFLARQFDMRTELGAYLDPVADKALLVSIYVVLAVMNEIPLWVAVLVVSRDVLIVGGVVIAWMMGRPLQMDPAAISKINTAAQIMLAAVVLADLAFAAFDLGGLRTILIVLVGVSTVLSTAVYVVGWVGHMGAAGTVDRQRDEHSA